jgi:hypothetical protein
MYTNVQGLPEYSHRLRHVHKDFGSTCLSCSTIAATIFVQNVCEVADYLKSWFLNGSDDGV